jgi:hypothetical protein
MSDEINKRTIKFDPNFLNLSNKTRKKHSTQNNPGEIKVRANKPRKKDETFKKASILRMIRKHQQEKYNKMLESFNAPSSNTTQTSSDRFKTDFEESMQFMDKLSEENLLKQQIHNSTLKTYPSKPTSLVFNTQLDDLSQTILEAPLEFKETVNVISKQPQYGCLKNGSLPTYRNWNAFTQKNKPNHEISNFNQSQTNKIFNKAAEMSQKMERMDLRKQNKRPKRMKQKRIIRRTFKIGKSKSIPKVSVLISNRTMRNNISTEGQIIKQKPIDEIKKYLIKHGLIRVGTSAPNDVLRKMYECSIMMCGEVQNHNPDNLLYNFLNSNV